jgi:type IV pilus assembly protein PilM
LGTAKTDMSNPSLFYKDKPLFGMDIGFNSLKVMQINAEGKHNVISGYGFTGFDASAVKDGVVINPEVIAQAAYDLFDKAMIGKITSRRVAATIPASRAYTRLMSLPSNLTRKELDEAVRFEAEQYIPISLDDLYLDFYATGTSLSDRTTEVDKKPTTKKAKKSDKGKADTPMQEVLLVAVPRKIVDSYMTLLRMLGLEVCALETTISASSRLVGYTESHRGIPTVLIDFGSISVDLTIYDKTFIVSGTVLGGGDDFTKRIADKLKVGLAEAHTIKTKYGLGVSKKQADIVEALSPILDQLIKEIRRVIRYYDERANGNSKIGQIITMGGGANMPGLSEYLTDHLRLPTRRCDPWQRLTFDRLQPPNDIEKSMYITAAGLALVKPKEIWDQQ